MIKIAGSGSGGSGSGSTGGSGSGASKGSGNGSSNKRTVKGPSSKKSGSKSSNSSKRKSGKKYSGKNTKINKKKRQNSRTNNRKKHSSSKKNNNSNRSIKKPVGMPNLNKGNNQSQNENENAGEPEQLSASNKTGGGQRAKNAGQAAKNKAKKVLKNKKVMMFIATHFIPIVVVILVILKLIELIGQYMFFTTMPGMILEKIKKFGLSAWGDFVGFFTGDPITPSVSKEDVVGLAQYLQDQGYDVYSCGLGRVEYEGSNGNNSEVSKKIKEIYPSHDGKEYLQAYIAANEATYVLSTYSLDGFLSTIGSAFESFVYLDPSRLDSNKDASTGMINILNTPFKNNEKFVKVDRESKKMTVYTHAIYDPIIDAIPGLDGKLQWGSTFSYDLSSWTGRYGKPTELSLAIHLSTMMPDLAYRVVKDKEMNTKVNIVLQDVDLHYTTSMEGPNGESYSEEEIIHAFLNYGLGNAEDVVPGYNQVTVTTQAAATTETNSSNTETNSNTGGSTGTGTSTGSTPTTSKVNKNPNATKIASSRRQEQPTVEGGGGSTETEYVYTDHKVTPPDYWHQKLEELGGDPEKERKLFLDIINEVSFGLNKISADIWGINFIKFITEDGENPILKYIEGLGLGVISRIFGYDQYYIYIKQGSEMVPGLNISYDALFELAEIIGQGANGVKNVKWPYIQSVTNHWFYNDIDFSRKTYRKASSARKKIIYESADENTAVAKEGIKIELDAILSAEEGVVYQVCEPEASGPNEHIKQIFRDKYYKYDGTTETAEMIDKLKLLGQSIDVDQFIEAQENGTLTEQQINMALARGIDLETPLIGKVPVAFNNKTNALAAFSMVENMHSEEADYIYRNLKDLVVDLNYFTSEELTSELKSVMQWVIQVEEDHKDDRFETTKDGEEFGLTIKGVAGKNIVAPENCQVISSGDTLTLKFTKMSDETEKLLKYIYEEDYKTINPDILVGLTMKIKGVKNGSSGTAKRGDVIGEATGDIVIKMIDIDQSLIEDVEEYMSQKHNNEYESIMKEKMNRQYEKPLEDIGRIGLDNLRFADDDNDGHTSYFYEETLPSVTVTEQEVYDRLRELGYTHAGTCAIMGIMKNESGFNINATNPNDGGYGLIQWTNVGSSRRLDNLKNWCANNNYQYNSLDGQLAFFDWELQTSYNGTWKVYDTLTQSEDLEEALKMFFCHDVAGTNVVLSNEGYYAETTRYTTQQLFDMRLTDAYAYYNYFK